MPNKIEIDEETLQDIINIETGLLAPLSGFMNKNDFDSVVEFCILTSGEVFTLPITLSVPENIYSDCIDGETIELTWHDKAVAEIFVESRFLMTDSALKIVFGTLDLKHPGVRKEKERSPYRIGGKTKLLDLSLLENALSPRETKEVFSSRGWRTIVGFQTRNPIHKAHEHIQRLGLDICDGLFINPITGWKKTGDFTEEAVMSAYQTMIREFYPQNRVWLKGLRTQMRYAGPREAVFHAIIRRNLGCTHFIIGRDHAGVGGYYGAYDAHKLARELSEKYDLGVELLLTREPYYCKKCKQVVTDHTCSHYNTHRTEISGTIIRKYISDGYIPDEIMLRREIFESIRACHSIFVE